MLVDNMLDLTLIEFHYFVRDDSSNLKLGK